MSRRLVLAVLLVGALVIPPVYEVSAALVEAVRGIDVDALREIVQGTGSWAPLVSDLLMIPHGLVPAPVAVLAATGLMFGFWEGPPALTPRMPGGPSTRSPPRAG